MVHVVLPPDDICFVYFIRTMLNHILQLLQQHGFIIEGAELASLKFRAFTYREHLEHHLTENASKTTTDSFRQEWEQILTQKLRAGGAVVSAGGPYTETLVLRQLVTGLTPSPSNPLLHVSPILSALFPVSPSLK